MSDNELPTVAEVVAPLMLNQQTIDPQLDGCVRSEH
jgi:hypothetical protein